MTPTPYRGPSAAAELTRRMTRPQRHRLLHGFPLAAGMPSADHIDPTHELNFDPLRKRELIVGVLPHPFCNPAVSGCGFCTFPHEPGNAAKTTPVVKAVTKEIGDIGFRQMHALLQRPVAAIYFGGGTANLCEPEPFGVLAALFERGLRLQAGRGHARRRAGVLPEGQASPHGSPPNQASGTAIPH